jgi:hypothetical protein
VTKKLNETALATELAGSAFFQAPEPGKATAHEAEVSGQASTPPDAAPGGPTTGITPVRPNGSTPVRRAITRYAFEFFQDQITELRVISLRQKLDGEMGSMSEMVRDAIDAYLAHRKEAEERA